MKNIPFLFFSIVYILWFLSLNQNSSGTNRSVAAYEHFSCLKDAKLLGRGVSLRLKVLESLPPDSPTSFDKIISGFKAKAIGYQLVRHKNGLGIEILPSGKHKINRYLSRMQPRFDGVRLIYFPHMISKSDSVNATFRHRENTIVLNKHLMEELATIKKNRSNLSQELSKELADEKETMVTFIHEMRHAYYNAQFNRGISHAYMGQIKTIDGKIPFMPAGSYAHYLLVEEASTWTKSILKEFKNFRRANELKDFSNLKKIRPRLKNRLRQAKVMTRGIYDLFIKMQSDESLQVRFEKGNLRGEILAIHTIVDDKNVYKVTIPLFVSINKWSRLIRASAEIDKYKRALMDQLAISADSIYQDYQTIRKIGLLLRSVDDVREDDSRLYEAILIVNAINPQNRSLGPIRKMLELKNQQPGYDGFLKALKALFQAHDFTKVKTSDGSRIISSIEQGLTIYLDHQYHIIDVSES